MARSAKEDAFEKFRFRLSVISIDLSVSNALEVAAEKGLVNASKDGKSLLKILNRSGFSDISLPKVNIKTFNYRENIDAPRFSKSPGLATYEPITLKRGVTRNRDLYDWYRLVNEDMALMAVAGELAKSYKFSPAQNMKFRKDVVIEVLDRKGEPQKGWYLFNAFPVAYKGGDDLSASAEEKLIEEFTLDYEMFLEFENGIKGFLSDLAKGAVIAAGGAIGNKLKDSIPKMF